MDSGTSLSSGFCQACGGQSDFLVQIESGQKLCPACVGEMHIEPAVAMSFSGGVCQACGKESVPLMQIKSGQKLCSVCWVGVGLKHKPTVAPSSSRGVCQACGKESVLLIHRESGQKLCPVCLVWAGQKPHPTVVDRRKNTLWYYVTLCYDVIWLICFVVVVLVLASVCGFMLHIIIHGIMKKTMFWILN